MDMRLLLLLILLAIPRLAAACDIALVMALDVSRSIDRLEFGLMRDGIASALLDREVVELIDRLPGGVKVTVTQWGSAQQQVQSIGWTLLHDEATIVSFATKIHALDREFTIADTSVSEALAHADRMFGPEVRPCRRHVIDIAADGKSNSGPATSPISWAIGRKGITINALVIVDSQTDLVNYFRRFVINGPLPFVEVANSFDDFHQAMKRKLLRELSPVVASLR